MDEATLRGALEDLHPAAWGWARHCCRDDPDEAADVLQSVYLKVLDGRARFGGQSAFRTWLFGVIRRSALEHRRRRWLHRLLLERRAEQLVPPRHAAVDESVERDDRVAMLEAALGSLSARQHEVVELVFQHGCTVDEAATVMGIPVGTARTHYARAKARLATRLRPHLGDDNDG